MLIRVKVFPNSKKDGITVKSPDSFEARVREKPEQGKANKAVVRLLSSYFKVSGSKIRFIKGGKEKSKIFDVKDGNG